jgi:hypothetical protein
MDNIASISPPQDGTSMHYPTCIVASCTGCLPPLPDTLAEPDQPAPLDLSIFRRDT